MCGFELEEKGERTERDVLQRNTKLSSLHARRKSFKAKSKFVCVFFFYQNLKCQESNYI